MAVLVERVRQAVGTETLLGVNVLRNDAAAALSIAAAARARFVRVNVHTGVALADQGVLEGRAAETLRLRRELDCQVEIWADVAVKHALMPPGFSLEQTAKDTIERGLADALIVTGSGTGQPTALTDLETVRRAVPQALLFVGSGVTPETVADALGVADGVIVGSALKDHGDVSRPVSLGRVRALVAAGR
jgi:membrane complex biogenesis BtpA family protein